MIVLDSVVKRYSKDVQIGPVSLQLPPGGIIALVGPNGAGKSTLLTMMGRLMPVTSGSITIGGLDVFRAPSKDVARKVSILRQENHFVTRLTVRQLVGFGRYPHSGGRLTQVDEDAISQAIDFLDMTDLEQRFLDQLSGGQRQRAYVAMVLAQDTGGAIRGVVRADFFWGFGPEAGSLAGKMKQQGQLWVLLPPGAAPPM